jgi:hypothetical protein
MVFEIVIDPPVGLPYLVPTVGALRISIVLGFAAALIVVGVAAPVGAAQPDESGLYNPDQGQWKLGDNVPFYFGNPGDTPFMGDWNNTGEDTPGLFRRSDGFAYLRFSNTQGAADWTYFFGNPSDVPLVGDFDGDGLDTVSIYRASEQRVYISNKLGSNGGSLGPADHSYIFGNPSDVPFVGDFDGDGIDTVGLHRPSTGEVFLRNEHAAGPADVLMVFGDPADHYVAGDWDGDGTDSPGVLRPGNGVFYQRNTNSSGHADRAISVGGSGWLPIAGRWRAPPGFALDEGHETLVSRYHVERYTEEGTETYVRDMKYWPRGFRNGLDVEPRADDAAVVNSAGLYAAWDALSPSTRWEFKNYGPRSNWMHFTLNRPARVAVVWRDDTAPAAWLADWESGGTVIIDGDLLSVFEKSFPAGPIGLGTVEKSSDWRHMYLVLLAEEGATPSAAPPVPAGYGVAPNGTCPPWVHDLHATIGPDGFTYNTWHPQIDPVYWCYFGHEHGSNPELIPGSPEVPYQYVARHVPQTEPDAGFKEFIFQDPGGEYWVRFVIHANSAHARRVCARLHTLYVMVYDAAGEEQFSAGFKNDYGAAFATGDVGDAVLTPTNCGYSMPALAAQVGDHLSRSINVGPGSNNYERWDSREDAAAVVNLGMVDFDHGFDIRNPMSHCVDLNCDTVGLRDPEYENGTRRTLQMATWRGEFTFNSDHALGQGEYYTNPYATQARNAGDRDAVRQYAEPGFNLVFAKNATANRISCVAKDPWLFDYTCHQIGGAGNLEHLPHVPDMALEGALRHN